MTRTTQVNKDDQANSNTRPRVGGARPWRVVPLAAALAVTALLAAACSGGGSHAPASGSNGGGSHAPGRGSNPDQNLAVALDSFASCMRSHGLPGFYFTRQSSPPSPPPSDSVVGFHGYYVAFDPNSPVFQAAQTTCSHLFPSTGGLTGSGAGTHQQLLHALKVVACMHSYGYPNWPDPVGGRVVYPAGVDTHSAQFQTANKACGLGAPPGS
jgi:hypothetical protein